MNYWFVYASGSHLINLSEHKINQKLSILLFNAFTSLSFAYFTDVNIYRDCQAKLKLFMCTNKQMRTDHVSISLITLFQLLPKILNNVATRNAFCASPTNKVWTSRTRRSTALSWTNMQSAWFVALQKVDLLLSLVTAFECFTYVRTYVPTDRPDRTARRVITAQRARPNQPDQPNPSHKPASQLADK